MEITELYNAASYASPFAPGKSIFPEQRRIFHRAECVYTPISSIGEIELLECGVLLRLQARGGLCAYLKLQVTAADKIRISLGLNKLVGMGEPYFVSEKLSVYPKTKVHNNEAIIELVWDEYVLRVEKRPFHISLTKKSCLIWELDREEIAGDFVTGPLGFRWTDGRPEAYLSSRLYSDEQFYGFGEKWGRVEKTGFTTRIWNNDTCGTNTSDLSYKAVPWLMSSRGWGLLLNSAYPSHWDVASFSHTSASCLVESASWDGFLILGESLKDLVASYTVFTGLPQLPPLWALGIWMSRCAYQNHQEVEHVVDLLEKHDLPCDLIHLDPPWMKHHYYQTLNTDACDFDWNEQAFPDRRAFFSRLKVKGIAVSLWVNPYIPEGGVLYEFAARKGYLVRSLRGGLARLEFGQTVGIVDFTLEAARTWWKGLIKEILLDGAATVKTDYADEVYGHGLLWRRPGYIGTQRYPISWAGDTQVSWEGLRGCLRGGLSAAFAGEAFWSHDIGGFCGPQPDPELYIRWMQFGMFSPCTRFHGTTPREPWHFGDEALQVAKVYTKLRYKLIPYLWQSSVAASKTGIPIIRPMVLEFPDEPGVSQIEDQYMLGSELLVAPIIHPGQRERWVYLPKGTWRSLENPQEEWEGFRYIKVSCPLNYIPVFFRADSVIPMWKEAPSHLKNIKLEATS
ncbi:MAG: hypothetical protein NTX25_01380 [Proteobacteria bacterium]|nr:hypothetical protein [Pseudomonadota bacterium]